MKKVLTCLLVLTILLYNCTSSKKGKKSALAGDRDVTVQFHPFWGGAAACDLERKNGKDVLKYYYVELKSGVDSTTTAYVDVKPEMADSLFRLTEAVNWTQPISDGTADPKTGMKVDFLYKKGKLPQQQLHWEKLSSIDQLPADVRNVLGLMNELAPAEFKMY